jgi:hypothetical protein
MEVKIMINLRNIITLSDDNEYIVVGKIDYEDTIYYYLVDINKNDNVKFCYQKDDGLVELNDSNLIKELIPLFSKQAMEEINNYIKENS